MSAHVEPVGDRLTKATRRVAENMRAPDVLEMQLLAGLNPTQAVARALRVSTDSYVGFVDDVPVTVFGNFTSALGAVGVPWLLATQELTDRPLPLFRYARKYIAHLRGTHSRLHNVIHADNTPSVLFLSSLGFAISDVYETATGVPVRDFTMEGAVNV
jgi:hypothetical protein